MTRSITRILETSRVLAVVAVGWSLASLPPAHAAPQAGPNAAPKAAPKASPKGAPKAAPKGAPKAAQAAPEPGLTFGDEPAESLPVPAGPAAPVADVAGGYVSCTGSPRLVPVCRKVPIKKKKPHVEYGMKCELVCVPGCGCLVHGRHGGVSCTGCDDGCGDDVRVREKHLLLKTVSEKETDSYEYKVEWVCAACAAGRGCCGSRPHGGPTGLLSGWLW